MGINTVCSIISQNGLGVGTISIHWRETELETDTAGIHVLCVYLTHWENHDAMNSSI